MAKAHLLKGDIANAAKYYEKAISVTPGNIAGYNQLRLEYIQVLVLASQDERARDIIKDLSPVTTAAEFEALTAQIAQVLSSRTDRRNGLIKTLGEAVVANPQNQNLIFWLAEVLAIKWAIFTKPCQQSLS